MKISVVGIGRVGSTLAYTLVMRGLCSRLLLINRRAEIAVGDAHDLRHAVAFVDRQIEVDAGSIADSAGSDIIAVCASVSNSSSGTDRMALGPGNAALFDELIPPLAAASPNAIFLILTNPVDVMTYHALQLSGFPPERVIGTGTLIDSARFREMLSDEIGIHPDDLRAYILGEHGPHQFAALSQAQVAGERIENNEHRREMFRAAVEAGHEVLRAKGHTNYAIALAASLIIEAIVHDTRRTVPVSTLIDGWLGVNDVCLSLPVVIGRPGITRILHPQLNDEESAAFRDAGRAVRDAIESILNNSTTK
ncbi:L-lactate dehydrogenase [Methylohalomonas lacus]|uniref:L-lactate dehydrogenase n=1 Tax=Methylohalomonas lacus TaxID=398773 RepID=A0AAE3HJV7_9GAMM|nr:lactate dehydrogenase [Methylohalomonas lacus]MCS3903095.1 L-lactate dehydrogenase [Methylohalomonas lacus]